MADTNSNPAPSKPTRTSPSPKKNDLCPIGAKIADLNEAQSELLNRLQGMKQDLQDWTTKLDTQVMAYKEELTDLKMALNSDLEQLKSDFQELRTTLQQQQDDITDSLRNLVLEDISEGSKEQEVKDNAHATVKMEGSFLDSSDDTSSIGGIADTSL